ncbi:hypothetical protein C8R44DRAFT_871421 [Mycena epipterygia]|nr:hypothetical protein C8R44DRAFT_871421 [Mycena epipterygia]
MVETMTRDAIEKSTQRDERDARVIVWTVQSLTEDNELEPFVEALPDLIWGPIGRRTRHDDMIKLLLDTHELQLVPRIEGLLRSCDTGLFPHDREFHRRITCIKALWAIAYFSVSYASPRRCFPTFNHTLLESQLNSRVNVNSHWTSAYSLVRWSGFCSLSSLVQEAIFLLDNQGNTAPIQDPWIILRMIQHEAHRQGYTDFSAVLASFQMDSHILPMPPVLIGRARDALMSFQDVAYNILTDYCTISTHWRTLVRQHWATFPGTHLALHHIDRIVDMILHVLQPSPQYFETEFAQAFVFYLASRDIPGDGVRLALGRCNPRFIGSLLTKYLGHGPRATEDILIVMLRVMISHDPNPLADLNEETLAAVSAAPRFVCSSSVVAILKTRILTAAANLPPDQLVALLDRLHLPNSCSEDLKLVKATERWKDALFMVLLEFLEQSNPLSMDNFNKRWESETFASLVDYLPCEKLSQPLKRRFATWFFKTVNGASSASHMHLIDAIIFWKNMVFVQSLNDQLTRQTIHAALTIYASRPSDGKQESLGIPRGVRGLLAVLAPPDLGTEHYPLEITDVLDVGTTRGDASSQSSDAAKNYRTPGASLNGWESDE